MAYVINKIKAGGTTYNIASTAYATCSTAASTAAKVAYIQGESASCGFTLTTGLTIHVKFTYANTAANPTLSVNETTATAIKCYGTTAAGVTPETSWFAGETVTLTYDGTYWQLNRNTIDLSSLLTYLSTLEQTARGLGIIESSGGSDSPSVPSSSGYWAAVNVTDLQSDDIVIITAELDSGIYALTYNGGNSVPVTTLIPNPSDDGTWFSGTGLDDTMDGMKLIVYKEDALPYFKRYSSDEYLYCTNANNGVRWTADAGSASRWLVTAHSSSGDFDIYMQDSTTSRYLCCYIAQDWRCYTTKNSTVESSPITIYKWISGENTPV